MLFLFLYSEKYGIEMNIIVGMFELLDILLKWFVLVYVSLFKCLSFIL